METIPIPGFSDPVSSMSHLFAAVMALIGGYFLYRRGRGNFYRLHSLGVYTFSLLFLFSMSGVYHMLEHGGAARDVLQRLDHAGIWVLIAGTFTPIHMILFRRGWRWLVLIGIWTVAITGLVLEVVFFTDFPEYLTLSLFLGLGWVGLLTVRRFHLSFSHKTVFYMVLGGIFYSLGAVLEFFRWPVLWEGVIGPHEIFHVFVVVAAVFHWKFIYFWSGYPTKDQLIFHVQIFPEDKYIARSKGDVLCIHGQSLSELKEKIVNEVSSHYWPNKAEAIHLKYFQEEHMAGSAISPRVDI